MDFNHDQNIRTIPAGDRLLIWGMRAWAYSAEVDSCPFRLLAPMFCRMGVMRAALHFHKAMSALHLGGADLCPLALMGEDCICKEESVLLSVWQQVLGNEHVNAVHVIEDLVDSEWVPQCFDMMTATSRELLSTRPALFRRDACLTGVAVPARGFTGFFRQPGGVRRQTIH